MPRTSRPIGVFDSGLGGLTVVRELRCLLPRENIVYLGDTARVPYGTRAATTVRRYAAGCAELLLEHSIKSLVIACNTASAVALEPLRNQLTVPVVGVVHPGAAAAAAAARTTVERDGSPARIGILGTAGTIRSQAYTRELEKMLPEATVIARSAPLLVPLAEEGWLSGDVPRLAVERYLTPMFEAEISVLVLGCTHYPLLVPTIREVVERCSPRPIQIVDGARVCAQAVCEQLTKSGELKREATSGSLSLLATDLPDNFRSSAELFLGSTVADVQQVDLPAQPGVVEFSAPPGV